jgi:hypothetical protein
MTSRVLDRKVIGDRNACCRLRKLIDAESELHALDSSAAMLVSHAVVPLFGCPLPDHI